MLKVKVSLENINERLLILENRGKLETSQLTVNSIPVSKDQSIVSPRFPQGRGPVNDKGQIKVGSIPLRNNVGFQSNYQQMNKWKIISSEEEGNNHKVDHRTQFMERGIKRSNTGNNVRIVNTTNVASSSSDESEKEKNELRQKLKISNDKMDDINKKLDLLINKNFVTNVDSLTNKKDNMLFND